MCVWLSVPDYLRQEYVGVVLQEEGGEPQGDGEPQAAS